MYVAVDVVHVRILGLAIWANNPIVIKEFDWCPAKVARLNLFGNVKSQTDCESLTRVSAVSWPLSAFVVSQTFVFESS